ncbi:hypothetical protein CsSME_00029596 [Camellia sinensis var. sinensis]
MKVWDIMHGRKLFDGIVLDACVMKYIPNWRSNIPPPGNAEQRVHGRVPPESIAVEVIRFYRGMIVHYNDNLNFYQPRIEKSDISHIAYAIFHGACAILRRACADVSYPSLEKSSIAKSELRRQGLLMPKHEATRRGEGFIESRRTQRTFFKN